MRNSLRSTACVLGFFAFVYFVIYPEDIEVLFTPLVFLVEAFSVPVKIVLGLSESISPWLYGTAIAAMLCWTATRLWQKPAQKAAAVGSRRTGISIGKQQQQERQRFL